jgi:outer membrane murein-binding lipoprotein Lpp
MKQQVKMNPFLGDLFNANALRLGALSVSFFLFTGCNQSASDDLSKRVESLEAKNQEILARLDKLESGTETAASEKKSVTPKFTDLTGVARPDYIDELSQLGVFEGTGSEFKPFDKITRGEFAVWIFKAYNAIRPENDKIHLAPNVADKFKDVPKDNPAYPYVQALANNGDSVGYTDGTFKPSQPITREESIAIKMVVQNHKDYPGLRGNGEGLDFTDKDQIDERYWQEITEDYGWTSNYNGTRAFGPSKLFKPKEPLLRNEAAAMLWQFNDWNAKMALQKRSGN